MTDDSITNEMWDAAFKWASNIYAGKRDKQDKPLMHHALRVMYGVKQYGPVHMLVALLHDTVEEVSPDELPWATVVLDNFPSPVAMAVLALTRKSPERYFDYIRRLAKNPIAKIVKLADLSDNMDLTRGVFEGQASLMERYVRSELFLLTGDEVEFSRPMPKVLLS
jgi:(p)ppGpp synthase/HD superfamily hydrolase